MKSTPLHWPEDTPLLLSCAGLCLAGLMVLWSATYQPDAGFWGHPFVVRQLLWICFGWVILWSVRSTHYRKVCDLGPVMYVACLILLAVVLAVGVIRGGAQRWLSVGAFLIQPSEFMKLVLVLLLARFLSSHPVWDQPFSTWLVTSTMVTIPMLLIMKQPDLGTALVLAPILLTLWWIWGMRSRWLAGLISAVLASLPLAWHVLKPYQRNRLLVFMDPNADPLGAGYTVIQSKIAIGSGGLFGKGWLAGSQSHLHFLPEHHTDFIFAVVGEEWGFLGALVLLALYGTVLWEGLKIASQTASTEGRLVAVGVCVLIGVHVFINMGMTLGILPVVGVPLPFVSYGGSGALTFLTAIGLLLSVKRHRILF